MNNEHQSFPYDYNDCVERCGTYFVFLPIDVNEFKNKKKLKAKKNVYENISCVPLNQKIAITQLVFA